ncbi:MAG: RluA family pseudouridine synthase [Thermoleophilaceae bacterium]
MSFRAGVAEEGMRLDAALAARGEAVTRSAGQRLIDRGLVTVNGRIEPKSHRVTPGEMVEVADQQGEPVDDAADVRYEVIYEDEHLLVVDKPAGVVVHPGAGIRGGTLAQALAGRAAGGPDVERAGIVHRLDRDTSGLLVIARSDAVHTALQQMIHDREVEREYLALVDGHPDARSGTIEAPIGRDRVRRTLVSTRTDRPRRAVTHFEVSDLLPRTALLSVRLETGRTHQIRAHLAAIGLPVCGDADYGGGTCGHRLGLTRQFLHSHQLGFRHPVTRAQMSCESKPPADLLRALEVARRDPVSEGPDGG